MKIGVLESFLQIILHAVQSCPKTIIRSVSTTGLSVSGLSDLLCLWLDCLFNIFCHWSCLVVGVFNIDKACYWNLNINGVRLVNVDGPWDFGGDGVWLLMSDGVGLLKEDSPWDEFMVGVAVVVEIVGFIVAIARDAITIDFNIVVLSWQDSTVALSVSVVAIALLVRFSIGSSLARSIRGWVIVVSVGSLRAEV